AVVSIGVEPGKETHYVCSLALAGGLIGGTRRSLLPAGAALVAGENPLVWLGGLQQRLVVALRDNPPLLEHDDVIRPPDLRQPVRDEQGGAVLRRLPDGLLDAV